MIAPRPAFDAPLAPLVYENCGDLVAWFPGLGYRPAVAVVDPVSGLPALILGDDRPFEGKFSVAGPRCGGRLDPSAFALWGDASTWASTSVAPLDAPAAVPLPSTGALMLGALVLALVARPAWRAAGRLADWFTAERGAGPGCNGWV